MQMKLHSSHPSHPPQVMGGGGGGELSHFSEHSNRRDLGRDVFWVGIGTLVGGDIFDIFRWDLKTPYIKNSEYIS